jgi:hypothetical protein
LRHQKQQRSTAQEEKIVFFYTIISVHVKKSICVHLLTPFPFGAFWSEKPALERRQATDREFDARIRRGEAEDAKAVVDGYLTPKVGFGARQEGRLTLLMEQDRNCGVFAHRARSQIGLELRDFP